MVESCRCPDDYVLDRSNDDGGKCCTSEYRGNTWIEDPDYTMYNDDDISVVCPKVGEGNYLPWCGPSPSVKESYTVQKSIPKQNTSSDGIGIL